MAPKKERDEALNEFSNRMFSSMLEELLMDVVLQSHQEIARSKSVCEICHTRCNAVHVPGPSNGSTSGTAQPSPDGTRALDGSSANGTDTPTGNIYFECSVCKRQIASNRYAPHLSSCMGLGNSRRGATRNASSKARSSDAGSPYINSEGGYVSDESKSPSKNKAKSKAKLAEDAEFSLNHNKKRNGSPSVSPVKKTKKPKTVASAVSRVKSDTDLSGSPSLLPVSHSSSQSKIPSKLRESSVMSIDRRSSSSGSRYSSPARSVSTFAIQSPVLAGAPPPGKAKSKSVASKSAANRYSPPRPPPPVIRLESDYLVDVEGEETGSSTDTDSD
ncbi:Sgf11 domain-containing protein [Phanerochaete sordida]|uniref:SAGA-associated factor 11 n=1 Tax=Phanerochaete sordida TaxID=48140 RepID=A0A9P3G3V8_9APHY|nr:Sgf11 domain-containing protein [Phanerochaete sordida]